MLGILSVRSRSLLALRGTLMMSEIVVGIFILFRKHFVLLFLLSHLIIISFLEITECLIHLLGSLLFLCLFTIDFQKMTTAVVLHHQGCLVL